MLILKRFIGESFRIGDEVKVTVHNARNGRIQFGIEAPSDIPVHREEIYMEIKKKGRTCIKTPSTIRTPQEE